MCILMSARRQGNLCVNQTRIWNSPNDHQSNRDVFWTSSSTVYIYAHDMCARHISSLFVCGAYDQQTDRTLTQRDAQKSNICLLNTCFMDIWKNYGNLVCFKIEVYIHKANWYDWRTQQSVQACVQCDC